MRLKWAGSKIGSLVVDNGKTCKYGLLDVSDSKISIFFIKLSGKLGHMCTWFLRSKNRSNSKIEGIR